MYHQRTRFSADVYVTALSAGRMHSTVQVAGAMCLAAAVSTPDISVWRMARTKVLHLELWIYQSQQGRLRDASILSRLEILAQYRLRQ